MITDAQLVIIKKILHNFMLSTGPLSMAHAKKRYGKEGALLLTAVNEHLPTNDRELFHGKCTICRTSDLKHGEGPARDKFIENLDDIVAKGQFPICFRFDNSCYLTGWSGGPTWN